LVYEVILKIRFNLKYLGIKRIKKCFGVLYFNLLIRYRKIIIANLNVKFLKFGIKFLILLPFKFHNSRKLFKYFNRWKWLFNIKLGIYIWSFSKIQWKSFKYFEG
jgi:hypothetical protein